jgi:hypothetical protein
MHHPAGLAVLVVLNLLMQLFDGVATYIGWEQFGEGNPLLRAGFEAWGAIPTLLIAKLIAAFLILLVARVPRPRVVTVGLGVTLGVYTVMSLIPWSLTLLA